MSNGVEISHLVKYTSMAYKWVNEIVLLLDA